MTADETRREVAACAECGRVYAATVAPNGETRLIGRPDGCRCGATELVLPDDPA